MKAMGQHLAKLLGATALSGCSLLYSPNNLDDKGASPDAAIADANPALLRLDEMKSPPLLEGAGQDGSAPQILVVWGAQMTPTATITVEPATPNANVAITVSNVSIAEDHNSFAALVTASYMDTVGEADGPIPLTVTMSQPGAPTPVSIPWELHPLDELTTMGAQAAPPAGKIYSHVKVTGDVSFMPGPTRAIVKAVGAIDISGNVTANATGMMAGAGGCDGGASQQAANCYGGGQPFGGGGGFADKGTDGSADSGGMASGDSYIKTYESSNAGETNRSSGGAGGGNLTGGGGVGGGGGGTIELTAGGDIIVGGQIEATGAMGGSSGLGTGAGGGSGGVVVLRSGNMLKLPTDILVTGGAGGPGLGSANAGGAGSLGRSRYDAVTTPGNAPAAAKRGPMLVRPPNAIFEMRKPQLSIVGNTGDTVRVIITGPDGVGETKDIVLQQSSQPFFPNAELPIGLDTICVYVPNGRPSDDVAKNCIEVAFVP
jgi:hypothetical protein